MDLSRLVAIVRRATGAVNTGGGPQEVTVSPPFAQMTVLVHTVFGVQVFVTGP
jgi:hypothetical protein